MATLVFGMNVSLDGYVDHMAFAPGPALFRHFIEQAREQAGSLYGRRLYEVMRYFDEDQADWSSDEREFAAAWRGQHKWVVSRSLASVGPNATLISDDVEGAVRRVKGEVEGEIEVGGPELAGRLVGLVDLYRMYLHPVVVGGGTPYFAGARPALRMVGMERMDGGVVRLEYAAA